MLPTPDNLWPARLTKSSGASQNGKWSIVIQFQEKIFKNKLLQIFVQLPKIYTVVAAYIYYCTIFYTVVLWRELNCVKISQGEANKSANRWGNLRAKGGVVLIK